MRRAGVRERGAMGQNMVSGFGALDIPLSKLSSKKELIGSEERYDMKFNIQDWGIIAQHMVQAHRAFRERGNMRQGVEQATSPRL